MKKLSKLLAVCLSFVMLLSLASCGGKPGPTPVEDYYEFDVSSIRTEMMIGSTLTVSPVLRNLGEVVTDAHYSVKVTLDSADVTNTVYNTATKLFTPTETGTHTFTFTVQNSSGEDVVQNGEKFTKTIEIAVVGMTFVQRDVGTAIDDIVIDDSDPTNATITFGDTYLTKDSTSGQFGISGINFEGNYKLVYTLDIKGSNAEYSDIKGPCVLFGVDREDGRDDNIYLKMDNGQIGTWFWTDNGPVPGGDEWTGSGWMTCKNKVPGAPIIGKHTIGFTRIIGLEEKDPPAYYVIEVDGQYIATLNIGLNYSEILKAVWIESFGVAATLGIESYTTLPRQAAAPVITAEYKPMLAGEAFDLMSGVTFTESWGCPAVAKVSFEVTDPNGAPCTVADNKFTPQIKGDYTVKITVADLLGVASTITATATTSASFNFGDFEEEQKINQEITVSPNFLLAGDAEKASLTLSLLKGNTPVSGITFDRTGDVFKFTVPNGGKYTLQATMTLTGGAIVVKTQPLAVVDPAAAKATISDMDDTTPVGKTKLGHIVYYTVTDTDNTDKTTEAIVEAFLGETVETAVDVTAATLYDVKSTTTKEDHLFFKVFRPDTAGTYWIKVHYINELGGLAETTHTITVTDDRATLVDGAVVGGLLYGGWLGVNEAFDAEHMAIGKDGTMIFDHVGAEHSYHFNIFDADDRKGDDKDAMISGDWTMKFSLTDLHMSNSGNGFNAIVTFYDEDGEVIEADGEKPAVDKRYANDTITVAGNKGVDLWGYQTSTIGTPGTIQYQWRGIWQAPVTDEFCPLDSEGNPIPFEEAGAYAKYGEGTHEYRIEFHASEIVKIKVKGDDGTVSEVEETRSVYYFFIDDKPEARHVLAAEHSAYTVVSRVQLVGIGVDCIMTGYSFVVGVGESA